MAYKVIILYQLYMPSYFLGTFTEYPYFNQDVPDIMIKELVGKSYEIVVRSLSKKEREKLTSDDN